MGRHLPTPEQLRVIQDVKPGVTLIRGAAGSGKTTTALIRLSFLTEFWRSRRRRDGNTSPVRVLVLTYNRTLRGYIHELAINQVPGASDLDMTISTFGRWATSLRGGDDLVAKNARAAKLLSLGASLPLESAFVLDEVDYLMGRFLPSEYDEYLSCRREQRGRTPRVDRPLREALLNDVVAPYEQWKRARSEVDWNDLAIELATTQLDQPFDIVIADEAQDFSANQVRAVLNHVTTDHSVTFILDAAQRIYPRHFQWSEVGISILPSQVFPLQVNHRNTRQIAAFAKAILEGLEIPDDGALPNFDTCTTDGPPPQVVVGSYSQQMTFLIDYISRYVNLEKDSVAFLHPLGGDWFDNTRERLKGAGLPYVDMAGRPDWPTGKANIGLSTLHSAKGLEFDHVFIVGLNGECTPVGPGSDDAQLDNLRRLVAMAVGRARKSVVISYKGTDASPVITFFKRDTFALATL